MARVNITSKMVVAYLEELARMGIYGSKAGTVATWIVRKEVMRLVEKGVLQPIKFIREDATDEDDES